MPSLSEIDNVVDVDDKSSMELGLAVPIPTLQGQTIGGTHIFKVDKIEIWNGVTSIN